MNELLKITNLHANAGEKEILKGLNLTINKGETHVIMGPNGSGKTTTANAIFNNPEYTNYKGYIFCPDFNLICTTDKDKICNNINDCINKKSEYKTPIYNYEIKDVPNSITDDIRNNTQLDKLTPIEGYELSNDVSSTCPVNCSQCISNRRCVLCRKFTNTEPHAYYIGEKDDSSSYINCTEYKPKNG